MDEIDDQPELDDASLDSAPKIERKQIAPPEIDVHLQLKWGLALLGKEKAAEYLAWVRERLGADSR